MREIKFKAWDKDKKVMIPNTGCTIKSINFKVNGDFNYIEKAELDENFDWSFVETNNVVLLQYTGLKDKNDVEIYNGDIILYNNKKYKIGYDKHCAGYKAYLISKPDKYNVHETTLCATNNLDKNIYIEVIGNIYENRKLPNEN